MHDGTALIAFLLATSLVAAPAADPMLLRELEHERSSAMYLRGVVDTVNGINNQQRLLNREPIFCPPAGPSGVTLSRVEAIIAKYVKEARTSPSSITESLPAAELVISQLRLDYPCSQRTLSHQR